MGPEPSPRLTPPDTLLAPPSATFPATQQAASTPPWTSSSGEQVLCVARKSSVIVVPLPPQASYRCTRAPGPLHTEARHSSPHPGRHQMDTSSQPWPPSPQEMPGSSRLTPNTRRKNWPPSSLHSLQPPDREGRSPSVPESLTRDPLPTSLGTRATGPAGTRHMTGPGLSAGLSGLSRIKQRAWVSDWAEPGNRQSPPLRRNHLGEAPAPKHVLHPARIRLPGTAP